MSNEQAQATKLPRLSLFPELKPLGVPYSKRQLDRLEAENKFPKRVPIGESRVGWVTTEVVAHVDEWIARRTMDAGKLGSSDVQGTRDNSKAVEAATAARKKRKPARAALLGKAATDAANKRRQTVTGKHKRERASA
ncbi:MAG: helix-turn-helix transcriptional regulator [Rhizomicrobium sp.]